MTKFAGILSASAASHVAAMLKALDSGSPYPATCRRQFTLSATGALAVVANSVPAVYEDDQITVALDGVIVDAPGLAEASSQGALVAALYRRHGFNGALGLLAGEVAIALYDRTAETLWLSRDRLGVKPLYYARGGGLFAFASRPLPLLSLPGVGAAINRRYAAVFAASHYRYIDNVLAQSAYERVEQLPAAHWLRWRDGSVQTGSYWCLEDAGDLADGEAELAERYRELLIRAVDQRRRASERPAFTLSGGLDSSSVLASAARRAGEPQIAYSTVYSDPTFDESVEIRPMLDQVVSTWNQVRVDDPDVFEIVPRMIAVNDEPVATATWLSHFELCRAAAAGGVKTLFGGLGGDELNAGEYEYFFFHFADLLNAGARATYNREIERWVSHHDHPVHRKSDAVAAAMIARCTDPNAPGVCLPETARMRRYYSVLDRDFYPIDDFTPIMEAPFASYLKTRTFQDLTRETAPCCLRAEDRQSAAFGIENQVPFFDHRLVEFMFRVPGTMKIRDGVTKRLLREAMRGILPEETRTRIKKTGWNAPAHVWFSGPALEDLLDLVHSRAFRERGIYDLASVTKIIDEHRAIVGGGEQRENHMMFLWQLVNLELWMRQLDGVGSHAA